jgi:ubiquinone biosynthesis protein UbiJ
MALNDEFATIDTPIQRIDEDRLSDILGDLIAKAAAPVFDEAFKTRAEKVLKSAELLADLIAERLKR